MFSTTCWACSRITRVQRFPHHSPYPIKTDTQEAFPSIPQTDLSSHLYWSQGKDYQTVNFQMRVNSHTSGNLQNSFNSIFFWPTALLNIHDTPSWIWFKREHFPLTNLVMWEGCNRQIYTSIWQKFFLTEIHKKTIFYQLVCVLLKL